MLRLKVEVNVPEKHLWEVDHPYYCSEENYFSGDCTTHFKSWSEFIEEEDGGDIDMNLVFRWDWEAPREDEGGGEGPIKWQGDENYRDSRLLVFWMGQRKGIFRSTTIEVCRADEAAIKQWLTRRFHHLLKLWTPLPLPTTN